MMNYFCKGLIISALALFSTGTFAQMVAVGLPKMNVLYIGIDNPIEVAVSNYAPEQVRVSVSQGNIEGENGAYIWRATTPGEATLTVKVKEKTGEKEIKTMIFRVKRIPDPTPRLGTKNSGEISLGELKSNSGVSAWLDNFDFDARCVVEGFVFTAVPLQGDPWDAPNQGGAFNSTIGELIENLTAGTKIYIDEIRVRCPGDAASRNVGSLVFTIK